MDSDIPSDCRIKHSICPVSNVLSNIDKLNFVSFCFLDESRVPYEVGILAHELKAVYPNMVVNESVGLLPLKKTVLEHALISDKNIFIRYNSNGEIKENDDLYIQIRKANNAMITVHPCVTNLTDESFEIERWPSYSENDEATLFGITAKDFDRIIYYRLAMLGPAGVKELHQIVKQQGATICAQQEQITALQEQVASILARLG